MNDINNLQSEEDSDVETTETAASKNSDSQRTDNSSDDEIQEKHNDEIHTLVKEFPKRALNSFMLFCQDKRNQLAARGISVGLDFQSQWSAEWRALSPEQREVRLSFFFHFVISLLLKESRLSLFCRCIMSVQLQEDSAGCKRCKSA